jgi:hypothetical protein
VLPVDLELGLARSARADAAAEPAHRLAPAAEPRQQIRELRELDLRLALPAPGVQREDVQDQRGTVDHLDLEPLLEAAELPGRELVVQDHRLGARAVHRIVHLVDLALADERGGVRVLTGLQHAIDGLRTSRVREGRQLVQVGLIDPATDADQHRLLGDAGAPGRGERRLERAGLVDAPASRGASARAFVLAP